MTIANDLASQYSWYRNCAAIYLVNVRNNLIMCSQVVDRPYALRNLNKSVKLEYLFSSSYFNNYLRAFGRVAGALQGYTI